MIRVPTVRDWLAAAGVVLLATLVSTWPVTIHPWSIPAHQDPLFSTWRLYQWSRNLFEQPLQPFEGNIFYDAPDVLLYSDAIPLPALLAAPWIRLGVPPLLVYDALWLASFLSAGLAMYAFARAISGSRTGALAAAVIFTAAPYRIEHIYHLELLLTCWMPLSLLAIHRAFQGTRPFALRLAAALVGQLLSCIYYTLFLLVMLPVFAGLRWLARPVRLPRSTIVRACAAGLVVVLAALIYSRPYERARDELGDRPIDEIASYGANTLSYVATPAGNQIWGWTAERFGARETRASSGVLAYALAAAALVPPIQPWAVGLAGGALVSFEASRGLGGFVYPALYHLSPFKGLRVPARFAALVLLGVAALAALGIARLEARFGTRRWWPVLAVALLAGLLVEYTTMNGTRALPSRAPILYAWLAEQPPTVLAHFPMPRPDRLPGAEADYQYFAQYHRHELVNGNSGYYPREYIRLLDRVRGFPDTRALAALRNAGVTLVIVHAAHYETDEYERITEALEGNPDVQPEGMFLDEAGPARVYRIQ